MIIFFCCVVLHSVNVPHFSYPFFDRGTFRLFPRSGYDKQSQQPTRKRSLFPPWDSLKQTENFICKWLSIGDYSGLGMENVSTSPFSARTPCGAYPSQSLWDHMCVGPVDLEGLVYLVSSGPSGSVPSISFCLLFCRVLQSLRGGMFSGLSFSACLPVGLWSHFLHS